MPASALAWKADDVGGLEPIRLGSCFLDRGQAPLGILYRLNFLPFVAGWSAILSGHEREPVLIWPAAPAYAGKSTSDDEKPQRFRLAYRLCDVTLLRYRAQTCRREVFREIRICDGELAVILSAMTHELEFDCIDD